MPNFGYYHDEGLYFTGSKSMVHSGSYRIESLPGTPYQTKYPPLLSVWHSLAWLIEPRFPQNLRVASFLQWIWLPVFAWLTMKLMEQWGFSRFKQWLVVLMLAVSPYPLFFSTAILSDIPFAALVVACMLLLGRGWILTAAVVAGLAFLTRTAGIALWVTVPAVLLLVERRRNDALRFFAVMAPFVLGWLVWSKLHQLQSTDELMIYYVNYLGYHFRAFTLEHTHLFLWKNLDFLLVSAGSFLLPNLYGSLILKITTQVIGVAGIIGAFRLSRSNPAATQFGAFAALSALLLVGWSFPPNERFLIPIVPIILAGYLVEFSRVAEAMAKSFRHKDLSQRIAGYAIAAFFAGILLFGVYTALSVQFEVLPSSMETARQQAAGRQPMYDWIRQNTKPETTFLVAYDTPFYLQTGRRGSYQIVNSGAWYREETQAAYKAIEDYARARGFDMILWTPFDRRHDASLEDQLEIGRTLAKSPTARLVKEFPNAFLFELTSRPPKTPEERSQPRP